MSKGLKTKVDGKLITLKMQKNDGRQSVEELIEMREWTCTKTSLVKN